MGTALLNGVWLGFCIAAPVGPIGVLVLTQALQRGSRAGLTSGLGAALADFIYGILAVAGVRMVAGYGRVVAIAGGAILLGLAWKLWWQKPADRSGQAGTKAGTATTFLLTLSNPMTILSFAAMVATVGTQAPIYFVIGVFLGSMLWWTALSFAAASLRQWIQVGGVVLYRVAAVTLACFGVWAILAKGTGA